MVVPMSAPHARQGGTGEHQALGLVVPLAHERSPQETPSQVARLLEKPSAHPASLTHHAPHTRYLTGAARRQQRSPGDGLLPTAAPGPSQQGGRCEGSVDKGEETWQVQNPAPQHLRKEI